MSERKKYHSAESWLPGDECNKSELPTESSLAASGGSEADKERKRQKAHPIEVVLEQCTECGAHAVNPNTDHCMKCGSPQRIGSDEPPNAEVSEVAVADSTKTRGIRPPLSLD